MERDMTVGNPAKVIFNFTVPIFLGNVFQQFYSMADTIDGSSAVGSDFGCDYDYKYAGNA